MALASLPPIARPLVDILADMVRSALAWEEEHGHPGIPEQSASGDGLTSTPFRIHCLPPAEGGPLDLTRGGDSYDDVANPC